METVSGGHPLSPPPSSQATGHRPDPAPLMPPPVPPQFSMQMDLIRQQLQFEAQHIRSLMEERFGTADEMVQRAQVGFFTPKLSLSLPWGAPSLMGSTLGTLQAAPGTLHQLFAPYTSCSHPTPAPHALHQLLTPRSLHTDTPPSHFFVVLGVSQPSPTPSLPPP